MPRTPTAPGTLVSRKEIKELTGLSRQRVQQITDEDPTFPRPVDVLWPTEKSPEGTHPIWKRAAFERWWNARREAEAAQTADRALLLLDTGLARPVGSPP